ncbi:hypothetical protein Micbo1qcDRAFT_19262 [Microdochium bolleyi]|uniref:Uncharacterized protein n=1 Tax=Microdochium bolleyi TaxID=196109 RepID=A0A136ITQ8_9PEZI|nr:hypothetical protein Micbo1qcDRAFT_19262 [Microdochium bolleyi]
MSTTAHRPRFHDIDYSYFLLSWFVLFHLLILHQLQASERLETYAHDSTCDFGMGGMIRGHRGVGRILRMGELK